MSVPPPPPPKPQYMRAVDEGGSLGLFGEGLGKFSEGARPLLEVNVDFLWIGCAEKISEDRGGGGSSYYVFHIVVNGVSSGKQHTVARSYLDFVRFHRHWSQEYRGIKHIQLPPRTLFNTARGIEKRRKQLEEYLRAVVVVGALVYELSEFLDIDRSELRSVVRKNSVFRGVGVSRPLPGTISPAKTKNLKKKLAKKRKTKAQPQVPMRSPLESMPPPPPPPTARMKRMFLGALGRNFGGIASAGEWDRLWDAGSGDFYFYNRVTEEAVWDAPEGFDDAAAVMDAPVGQPQRRRPTVMPNIRGMASIFKPDVSGTYRRPLRAAMNVKPMGEMGLKALHRAPPPKTTKKASDGGNNIVKKKTKKKKKKNAAAATAATTPGTSNKVKGSKSPWRWALDPETGDKYYFHKTTGETTWDAPRDFIDSRAHNRRPSVRHPVGYKVKDRVKLFHGA